MFVPSPAKFGTVTINSYRIAYFAQGRLRVLTQSSKQSPVIIPFLQRRKLGPQRG